MENGNRHSTCTFLGVLTLTNLGILPSFGYLILGAAVSLIPLGKLMTNRRKLKLLPIVICGAVILTRGLWIMNGYTAVKGHFFTDMENVIRKGPALGMVAPLSIVDGTGEEIEDWRNAVEPEDVVLAVGEWITDSIVYLYTDAEVANYSTIDTATYDDSLEKYWDAYPQKRPGVIAYKTYEGGNLPGNNTYIGRLIFKDYDLYYVGKQWVFYRRKTI